MLNLRLTRETWNPEDGIVHQNVLLIELPDDPVVIATVVSAAGEALEKYNNKPKPGGDGGTHIIR